MTIILFVVAVVVIVVLALVGAVVAATIVAQNWRFLVYISATMVGMALIAAACHALGIGRTQNG